MRISDWSSDVCSSDLLGKTFSAPPDSTRYVPEQKPGGLVLFVAVHGLYLVCSTVLFALDVARRVWPDAAAGWFADYPVSSVHHFGQRHQCTHHCSPVQAQSYAVRRF